MDNHPIPQDITGFEFKLIGNMTLKQFAYVAGGAILGLFFYASPLFFLIKILLALASIGTGVAFAFVPFEGRPLDLMVKNLIKAVLSPTQYVYQKMDPKALNDNSLTTVSGARKQEYEAPIDQFKDFLNSLSSGKNKLNKKESVYFESLPTTTSSAVPANLTPIAPAPLPVASQVIAAPQ